jgi:outer membrane receptor protein involved in Fe transport
MNQINMSIPNLFRTLKAEAAQTSDGNGPTQSAQSAAANAEKHWPLLKSISPKKWQSPPKLDEAAKVHRRTQSEGTSSGRPTAVAPQRMMVFSNDVNRELASGLTRMLSRKTPTVAMAVSEVSKAPSVATQAAQRPAQQDHDSISAVLRRLESNHQAPSQTGVKPAGFLSRLGRR